MQIALTWVLAAFFGTAPAWAETDPHLMKHTQDLITEITARGKAYDDLRELTDLGHRLTGSPNAERAIAWAKAKMLSYGFERVTLQPMTTPVWTRGEVARAIASDGAEAVNLAVAALGGSVGTRAGGFEAEVVEVQGLDDVDRLGEAVRGKIVFYNRPMDRTETDTFKAYGGAIDQRVDGASRAARYGAVGSLVRSLTTLDNNDDPHTGSVDYSVDAPRIPAAALSTRAANELSKRLKSNPTLKLTLELSARNHGNATSYNVIGDLVGDEHPEEIVLVGGHLDSWDLGVGAHDDGAGVVQSIEVLRALKALGIKTKRTVRVVLFMAEELGGYGGKDYAWLARHDGVRHIAAIESDRGGFAPLGFATDAGAAALRRLQSFAPYLTLAQAATLGAGGSGTDVAPLRPTGADTLGLIPVSTHYFDYHHAHSDQFSAINKDDLHMSAAAMAVLAYLYADAEL